MVKRNCEKLPVTIRGILGENSLKLIQMKKAKVSQTICYSAGVFDVAKHEKIQSMGEFEAFLLEQLQLIMVRFCEA